MLLVASDTSRRKPIEPISSIPTPEILADGLRLLRANNPSPMTERGTNTYLLGNSEVAVIDPGPDDLAHLDAILHATQGGQRIAQIWVTHSHLDHSALVPRLADATGAKVMAFGRSDAGRTDQMTAIAKHICIGGGEGVDHNFTPDVHLRDGAMLEIDGIVATAHWTPGHFCNHLSFDTALGTFTGDLIMGWASSLVSPPDGDLSAYMASLDAVEALDAPRLFSGHGAVVEGAQDRIRWLRDHRLSREGKILAALDDTPVDLGALTQTVYADVPVAMHPAAARNLLAHLIDLERRGKVLTSGTHGAQAKYRLA